MDSGTVKAGKPRAARGQIQELRNTGLSHYKYPWKSDGGGREQEQVVRGPCMHITSLEQSLWGHEPCVLYSKSTFTQRRDNCLFLRLDAPLPHAKDWYDFFWYDFFYTTSCAPSQFTIPRGEKKPCLHHKHDRKSFRAQLGRKRTSQIF